MNADDMILFAATLGLEVAIPGPVAIALIARTLAKGRGGAIAFIAGQVLGDEIWLAAASLGLSTLAADFHHVFYAMRLLGAGYLLYLAYRAWTAPVAIAGAAGPTLAPNRLGLFAGGLALSLGNPETGAFYLALLPTLVALDEMTLAAFGVMSAVTVTILAGVLAGYVLLADRMRGFIHSPGIARFMHRLSGGVLACMAVGVAIP